jgi:asparagine synthetase B (glutamine-hydrolysing)
MTGRQIQIEGVPVLSGRVLQPTGSVFDELQTIQDFSGLARRLRGPFALLVRDGAVTTLVTDFGGLFPIYCAYDASAGGYLASTKLNDFAQLCSGRLAARAVLSFAQRGQVGFDPMYEGTQMIPAASVVQLSGRSMETEFYMDWGEFFVEKPITLADAHERFIDIATSYLRPLIQFQGTAACFLSGGVDSALVAHLLQQAGAEVKCLCADYAFKRYSEWDLAASSAQRLHLPLERVPVNREMHRRALLAMNGPQANLPVGHSQLTSLYCLGEAAMARNAPFVFTGDNAGPIFLEFDHFFRGFPQATEPYGNAVKLLSTEQKLTRMFPNETIGKECQEILACFGLTVQQCQAWLDETGQSNRERFHEWAAEYEFPKVVQVFGQLTGGVVNQNCWLPAQQAIGGRMQMLSPFLDIEMIRFALSLPLSLKYRDGVSKFLLRDVLEKRTGIRLPKRGSPNPSRVWHLFPNFADLARSDARLRSRLTSLMLRNVASIGSEYAVILRTIALGIWLANHKIGPVGSPDASSSNPLSAA